MHIKRLVRWFPMLSEYYQTLKLQIYKVNEHHKIQCIDF